MIDSNKKLVLDLIKICEGNKYIYKKTVCIKLKIKYYTNVSIKNYFVKNHGMVLPNTKMQYTIQWYLDKYFDFKAPF